MLQGRIGKQQHGSQPSKINVLSSSEDTTSAVAAILPTFFSFCLSLFCISEPSVIAVCFRIRLDLCQNQLNDRQAREKMKKKTF